MEKEETGRRIQEKNEEESLDKFEIDRTVEKETPYQDVTLTSKDANKDHGYGFNW